MRNLMEGKGLALISVETREESVARRGSAGRSSEFTADHIIGVHDLSIQFGVLVLGWSEKTAGGTPALQKKARTKRLRWRYELWVLRMLRRSRGLRETSADHSPKPPFWLTARTHSVRNSRFVASC